LILRESKQEREPRAPSVSRGTQCTVERRSLYGLNARAQRHAALPEMVAAQWAVLDMEAGSIESGLCSAYVQIRRPASLRMVMQRMVERKASCAVVWDEASRLVGTIDWLSVTEAVIQGTDWLEAAIVPLVSVKATEPLQTAAQRLKHGARNVVVRSSDGSVSRVLSQQAVLRAASKHDEAHRRKLEATLASTVGPESVCCVPVGEAASTAFDRMVRRGYSSLPLCSEDGTIVGVIAASDTALLATVPWDLNLAMPCSIFVAKSRASRGLDRPHNTVIACSTTEGRVSTVVELMIRHSIHHVYLVDGRNVPTSIVSCGDVLRYCL